MDEGRYVIFIGSPVLDNYFLLDRWPAQGDKMRVDYMGKLCGGMIGNAARNCASLGVRSCCFDVVDTDRDGELIMQAMQQDHVDTSHIIRRHHQDKLLSIVMVSGGERNVFLSGSRPRHELTLTPEQKSFFYHADYVYGELLFPWLIADDLAFLQDLKAHGVKLVFDLEVTMFADDWYERAACANIIFTNEFGADKFRGDGPLEAFAHRLFGEGSESLSSPSAARAAGSLPRRRISPAPATRWRCRTPPARGTRLIPPSLPALSRGWTTAPRPPSPMRPRPWRLCSTARPQELQRWRKSGIS